MKKSLPSRQREGMLDSFRQPCFLILRVGYDYLIRFGLILQNSPFLTQHSSIHSLLFNPRNLFKPHQSDFQTSPIFIRPLVLQQDGTLIGTLNYA